MLTITEIIEKALKRLGVYAEGEEMTSEMYNSAFTDLNLVNISLNQYHKRLWSVDTVANKISKPQTVTNGSKEYYCIQNNISSAESEPGVGVDWELYWRVGNVSDTLPASWVLDTEYINGATIALEANVLLVDNAYYKNQDTSVDIEIINRFQQSGIVDKSTTGAPLEITFTRNAEFPTVRVYPLADSDEYTLFVNTIRLQDDIGGQGDNPDVPAEWLDFLINALAYKQGFEYVISPARLAIFKNEAEECLRKILNTQSEVVSNPFCKSCY